MRSTNTRGFTLPEALIGGALFITILAALLISMNGERRQSEMSGQYLSLMENVAVALQQLRTDLREIVLLPQRKVNPFSVRVSNDYRAVRFRHSPRVTGKGSADAYVFVEYSLKPAPERPGRYHLARIERASDGSFSEERVFRSFMLKDASFHPKERWRGKGEPGQGKAGGGDRAEGRGEGQGEGRGEGRGGKRGGFGGHRPEHHVLHIALELVADQGGGGGYKAFEEKSQVVTAVLQVKKPHSPWLFAEDFTGPDSETPPEDIRCQGLNTVEALPAFAE